MKKPIFNFFLILCILFISSSYSLAANQSNKSIHEVIVDEQTNDRYYVENDERFKQIEQPSVAVALGGGGARALVNVGVLKALEEENIPIDIVTGTSMGAIVAVLYGSGISVEDLEKLVTEVDLTQMFNLNFPFVESLINAEELNQFLEEIAPAKELENFPIPTALLSYDLTNGVKYIHTTGDISAAVQAPYAIPLCFPGLKMGDLFLIDAGILELTPSETAKVLGADLVIATTAFDELPYTNYDKLIRSFMRMINLIKEQYSKKIIDKYSDVVIVHDVGDFSFMDFQLAQDFIDLGYNETKKQIPVIKEMLAEKNIPLRKPISKSSLDLGPFKRDLKYGRLILDGSILKPLFYYGKDYSIFKQNLFKESFFQSQYGFEWKNRKLSTLFLTNGFKLDNLETKMRFSKVTPNIDLIGKIGISPQRKYYEAEIVYYSPYNYTQAFGFSHLNQNNFLKFRNTYDLKKNQYQMSGETDLLIPIQNLDNYESYEVVTSHDLLYKMNDVFSVNPKLLFSSAESINTPIIYRGKNQTKPLQASVDITYTKNFPYSLEIIQIIQVIGIDYYSFVDLQNDWKETDLAIGGGVNVDFKLLGLKSSTVGGYISYDLAEKVSKLFLELDFTF
ncbi:MAG: patatin-like phospholipase family protein [Halanaerobiales bacterium]|nr:patatin-like phospholipase family protein [Halanaerobiales bacterium]